MSLTEFAYPGLPLCPSSKHVPGPGTYIYNSQIHATIAGQPSVSSSSIATNSFTTTTTTPTKQPQKSPQPSLSTLCISRLPPSTPNSTTSNTLPRVSSIVLARVTRVTARQVNVSILVVDDQVCRDEWSGVIRVEDIRGWEKDKVVTYEGFRAGDIVRGEVISLGDQANYYLTTARNELGVLMAKSEYGNQMVPISWKEFKDPITGIKEQRKVAKPF